MYLLVVAQRELDRAGVRCAAIDGDRDDPRSRDDREGHDLLTHGLTELHEVRRAVSQALEPPIGAGRV